MVPGCDERARCPRKLGQYPKIMSEHKNNPSANAPEQKIGSTTTPIQPTAGSSRNEDTKDPRADANKSGNDSSNIASTPGSATTKDGGQAENKNDGSGTEGNRAQEGQNQDGNRTGGDASRTVAESATTSDPNSTH